MELTTTLLPFAAVIVTAVIAILAWHRADTSIGMLAQLRDDVAEAMDRLYRMVERLEEDD